MSDLRYPVGKFQPEPELNDISRQNLIRQITETPAKLREAVKDLTEEQLDTPYRPGGWTVRQVVHHLSDSHINAYIRFKLGMTEDHPPVKAYKEGQWAELVDAKSSPVEPSLTMLDSLHQRWTVFLRSMATADFSRTVNHSENGTMTLDRLLQLYAWHGRHHVAHITSLRERMNWK